MSTMTPEQIARWESPAREPFHLFRTVGEELSAGNKFWHGRTPNERMEYLEFMRCAIYGEEVINAKIIRCYGFRKLNEEADPKNVVYF